MQGGWKPGFISYQQSELWEWRPRDNKRVVIYLKILLWFVGFVWLCQFLPHASERFDKIGRNTHQEFENEMRQRDWPHFTHQGKEDHLSKKKGEEMKRWYGGPSCTSVISLMSHCCFSITLSLGQVLEEGKKSKTRPIDVTLVRHHFIHHHRDHDQLILIL